MQVPGLAAEWNQQVEAQAGWGGFKSVDFEKLKEEFGVNWVLVSLPQTEELGCKWHNGALAVCEVP